MNNIATTDGSEIDAQSWTSATAEWDHAIEFLVSMTGQFRECLIRPSVVASHINHESYTKQKSAEVIIDSCKVFRQNCVELNRRMLRVFLALLIEMLKCARNEEKVHFWPRTMLRWCFYSRMELRTSQRSSAPYGFSVATDSNHSHKEFRCSMSGAVEGRKVQAKEILQISNKFLTRWSNSGNLLSSSDKNESNWRSLMITRQYDSTEEKLSEVRKRFLCDRKETNSILISRATGCRVRCNFICTWQSAVIVCWRNSLKLTNHENKTSKLIKQFDLR